MVWMNEHDVIKEIREKVDIVDIIGERIPLVQRGKNFFGVCPFHDDTNPSMSVSREKQIYTCFSCHATGNVYQFLMDYEHIEFKEALEMLANRVGVTLKGYQGPKKSSKYDSFYDIYSLSLKYYQNNLNTSFGKEAKKYLAGRKIDDAIIKEFEIGLSLPSMNDLTELLTKKNISLSTLNDVGLSVDGHDTFIDRITFPLYDISGKVVGFSGRIYKNQNQNKYLNTKETPIFKKGLTLYHYHIAKEEARKEKQVIIMEGFMDVIRASTIGVRNTVALMGTALTKEQANLIKRLSSNIILCFDGDDAGKKATLLNGNHFKELGIEPKVICLSDDFDPDTYILTYGKERFLGLIDSAIPFSDYKINVLKQGVNLQSDEEKAKYIDLVLTEAGKIEDEIRVEIILKKLAKEFDISYNTLEKRLQENRKATPKSKNVMLSPKQHRKASKYEKAMMALLYSMIVEEKAIAKYEEAKIFFPDETYRLFASELIYYYKQYGTITLADFYTYLRDKENLKQLLDSILEMEFSDIVTDDILDDYIKVIKEYGKSLEMKRLKKLMEKEMDPLEQAKIADMMRKLRIGVE